MMRVHLKNISTRSPSVALLLLLLLSLCVNHGAAKPSATTAVTATRATTLAQYRVRLTTATMRLDELATLCERISDGERYEVWSKPGADTELPLTLPGAETKILDDVRRLLPQKEKIEWGGGVATEIDNAWLDRALQNYAQKSAKNADSKNRARMLREIVERLRALDARLAEVVESKEASARDKDAEKGRLAAILRGNDYNQKASQGGALARLIEQFLKWIRSLMPDVKPIQPGTTPTVSRFAQIFVLALGLAVIAYVARRYWLRRRDTPHSISLREARVVLGEHLTAEQTASDLLSEAERRAREGDLRGAIRTAYIALLCELGDRKIIRLAQHKTNRDYLKAVRQSAATPQLFQAMQPLTSDFERHWYGFEDTTETDWTSFSTRCRQALRL